MCHTLFNKNQYKNNKEREYQYLNNKFLNFLLKKGKVYGNKTKKQNY